MSLSKNRSSNSRPVADEELGHLLERARVEQGLSGNQLSKLAGVSRKHLYGALNGGNISVLILRKLLGALGCTLTIGPSELSLNRLESINPAQLAVIVPYLDRAVMDVTAAADMLRGMTGGYTAGGDEMTERAAALVERFATHITAHPETLAGLETTIPEVISEVPPKPTGRARRKG
jgi:transcriptional regulator with XRE-family HTH domain